MSGSLLAPDPTRSYLSPDELLEYARFVAAEVALGRYLVEYNEVQRWHQRLYRDQRVDLWLISWLPSQGTQLHDHGGSAGAFTVLTGELAEAIYRPGGAPPGDPAAPNPGSAPALIERCRLSGSGVGFGPHYIHDVRNLSQGPAISVHAYSPPLTSMGFYNVEDSGELRKLMTMATEDPEPVIDYDQLGAPAA
jgi:predicted metal-dependent enzyme (double-stranded beta helix superfamily)